MGWLCLFCHASLVSLVCGSLALAQTPEAPFLFSSPTPGSPTPVQIGFDLQNIVDIDGVEESFVFTGVLTLVWQDSRVAFDPDELGAPEVIYQGSYQFNHVAAGWYPEVVLVNDAGELRITGVHLRVQPDGTSILTQQVYAIAEADFFMRSFPFDSHDLTAAFSILGSTTDDIDLEVLPFDEGVIEDIQVPEWSLVSSSLAIEQIPVRSGASSVSTQQAVLAVHVERQSFYMRRLINFPMAVIVLLSFSIFWLESTSASERNSVSFIGVLTAVAYQQIVIDIMPPVSYPTFLHGMLFFSFVMMSATIPVNLLVAALARRDQRELGHHGGSDAGGRSRCSISQRSSACTSTQLRCDADERAQLGVRRWP